ncbi:hypothetical protein [Neobacillus cucumis]|uniref:hypothetical protein n=1 Tax=Neobacillus cucumis TaxID=1740721 RepID=UPI0019660632|nr:hypothetical protein [Neobacillus cucumis]MBM7651775.1 hypothetical protein [Neobacillus cucumis]
MTNVFRNTERLGVYMTPDLKEQLFTISQETGISLNNLSLIAITSLVANYQEHGQSIFVEIVKMRK